MPTTRNRQAARFIQTGSGEAAISESEYRNQVQAEKTVVWNPGGDEVPRLRVWDTIGGRWLPRQLREEDIHLLYLRKAVYKCSACSFTSARRGDVEAHANGTIEQTELHRDAEIEPSIGPNGIRGNVCTGCNATFYARANGAKKHLARVTEQTALHTGTIEELVVKKFTLSPAEPTVLSRRTVLQVGEVEKVPVGPDSAQVVGSIVVSSRKRHRKHGSRSKRGNANAAA